MAPACCALFSFTSKLHTPRRMNAIRPVRLPAGRGSHARPLWSSDATETRGAVIGVAELAPDPGIANAGLPPATVAEPANCRSFLAAPTVMAEGEVPGESMVSGS